MPKFVKELLARAFLKNPDAYIRYLRERERRRQSGLPAPEGGPGGMLVREK